MTLANYLYALIYSGTYNIKCCEEWANKVLEKGAEFNTFTEWIFDLAFSKSEKEIYDILSEPMQREDYYRYNNHSLTEIIQGYYYNSYILGMFSLQELFQLSGEVADAGQDGFSDCEYFFDWLNEIEKNPELTTSIEFQALIKKHYLPLWEAALTQKKCLETCTISDLKF